MWALPLSCEGFAYLRYKSTPQVGINITPSHRPREAKLHSEMQALLDRGNVEDAVNFAHLLLRTNALDAKTVLGLFVLAQQWHMEGYPALQRDVCSLVLSVVPDYPEAWHLLGYHAQTEGDFVHARDFYARAVAASPKYAFSRLALAQIQMQLSHFTEGLEMYEARFEAVTEATGPDWRGLPIERWMGESLTDKKLYIWAEQGLGDIIMFAGFLPCLIAQKPSRIALGLFPKLITLFQRSFPTIDMEPIDDVINHALAPSVMEAFPHIERLSEHASLPFSLAPLKASYNYVQQYGLFDCAAPLGDMVVHLMPGYIPARHSSSYLTADPQRVIAIRERLSKQGLGRRIGISWHTTNKREAVRNIPLEEWLPILRIPGCHFISLQHQVDSKEIEKFCAQHGCRITVDSHVDLLGDAEELAALIAAMDEVITIDNSNVHLAGALGISTTLLLPRGHNFRWPQQKDGGTLWYKNVHTLRQTELRNWQVVMEKAAEQLYAKMH